MSQHRPDLKEPRAAEGPEMIVLMREGVAEALLDHRRAGRSIVVWDREANQIVEIPPNEIVIPEGSSPSDASPID